MPITFPTALSTPLIAGDAAFNQNLSPDALMVYLQTRLDGLDTQVDTIINDQERQQKAQSILRGIQNELAKLNKDATEPTAFQAPPADGAAPAAGTVEHEVGLQLEALRKIDPHLADTIEAGLTKPGQLFADDGAGNLNYIGSEVAGAAALLDGIGKDLESTAQINMIRLQSIMSSRQTAVQLATNMVSSLGETTKSIVSNLGH